MPPKKEPQVAACSVHLDCMVGALHICCQMYRIKLKTDETALLRVSDLRRTELFHRDCCTCCYITCVANHPIGGRLDVSIEHIVIECKLVGCGGQL